MIPTQNGQVEPKVLRQIKALLNLSRDRAAQPGEMEAAMAKAQELLLKYNLDMADVHAYSEEKRNTEEPLSEQPGHKRKKLYRVDKHLLRLFANFKNFGVRVILLQDYDRTTYPIFLGRKTNVVTAAFLYEYLREEFSRRWSAHQKFTGVDNSSKNDFFFGMYLGINDKLREMREEIERKAQQSSSTSMALVRITKDEVAVQNHQEKIFGKAEKHKMRERYSGDQMSAMMGYEQGRRVNISTPLKK